MRSPMRADVTRVAGVAGQDDRVREPERVVEDLRLRQVERVLPFDRPGREVVGDEIARDLAVGGEDERQLRLGNVPGRVAPDPQRRARRRHAVRRHLHEQLGPLGREDHVVRGLDDRFLDPRLTRALVGHPRRPDLLQVDGREHLDVAVERVAGQRRIDRLVQRAEPGGEQLASGSSRGCSDRRERHEELVALVPDPSDPVHQPVARFDRRYAAKPPCSVIS